MCLEASFVATKDRIFWSKKTDSHEEIIEEFSLNPDGTHGANIVRVELLPVVWNDISTWEFKLDQDMTPEWFDRAEVERRAREAAVEWRSSWPGNRSGDIDLRSLTSAEGLPAWPEKCRDIYLPSLTSAEGLPAWPEKCRDIDLRSLTSADGLPAWPEKCGTIYLNSLTSAEGMPAWPKDCVYIYLRSLTSAEGLPAWPEKCGYIDLEGHWMSREQAEMWRTKK